MTQRATKLACGIAFAIVMTVGIGQVWAAPLIINADAADRGLRDSDQDELGNGTAGATSSVFQLGEASDTSTSEIRLWIPFALSAADRAAIAVSPKVELNISLSSATLVDDFDVDLYGLPDRTQVVPINSTYEAAGTLLADSAYTASSPSGYATFDVTAFAKTEAAKTDSILGFRLQADPATLPNGDNDWNRYIFRMSEHSSEPPFLEVAEIPEPATLMMAALGGLACLRRRG